jgi:hypothetical protein
MGDPWADEGYGGEDDWGEDSLAADLEEADVALGEPAPDPDDLGEPDADSE